MKIVIVDYEMGNIKSIVGALHYLGVDDIVVSHSLSEIESSDKLILPGVGSFSSAMSNIKKFNIDRYLRESVIINKKPILGICLGMQLMMNSSVENGHTSGLGFVDGTVNKFNEPGLKVPHMGFNQIDISKNSRLFRGIDSCSDFYFVHSFKVTSNENIYPSMCNYGGDFIASYEKNNIAAVQFHPELSQVNGLKLLNNFIENF
jgi:glutamine amidotransferase